MKHVRNTFRIIAGQWRGRTLPFAELPALRPTTDRIRETLFNWLQTEIVGARCLDLFSGSGALSLEALSRQSASVTGVELSSEAVKMQRQNAQVLGIDNLTVVQADARNWLQSTRPEHAFDIVFLDPPYQDAQLEPCCRLLEEHGWLSDSALIYLEDSRPLSDLNLPPSWQLLKHKKAGQVHYGLWRRQ